MPSTLVSSSSSSAFASFLQSWISRLETLLHELLWAQENLDASHEHETTALIAHVFAHYLQYFEEKSRMASRNVFLMFSPTWFTPLEKSFLWIGGFKPCLPFNLVANSVADLTRDQTQHLQELRLETRQEEEVLADELAMIQEGVAAPPLADQAKRDGNRGRVPLDGEIPAMDTALETLKSSMENLIPHADVEDGDRAEGGGDIKSCPKCAVPGGCCSASAQNQVSRNRKGGGDEWNRTRKWVVNEY